MQQFNTKLLKNQQPIDFQKNFWRGLDKAANYKYITLGNHQSRLLTDLHPNERSVIR